MQNCNEFTIKEARLRGNNIVHGEENLVNMYSSFLSAEREGTMKLELYNLLNNQKEILKKIQGEVPISL